MPVDEAVVSADATCQQLLAKLETELGAGLLESAINRHDVVIRVALDSWVNAATVCRRKLGMQYFCFLSGLDWLVNPAQTTRYENVWGSVEEEADADPAEANEPVVEVGIQTGLAGGSSRFQVFARYFDVHSRRGVVVKADVDADDPRVPTISSVYPGADWHERETWEMFGIWFDGHPNLVHIYLPGGFEGYPLRKDFPLLAREVKPWPGLTNVEPIAGEADAEEGAEG